MSQMTKENKNIKEINDNFPRKELKLFLYEFLDTLIKIKSKNGVKEVCFMPEMSDLYVVTEQDNIDLSESVMQLFAQWEAQYKVFPELHIINEKERFYIPNGAACI